MELSAAAAGLNSRPHTGPPVAPTTHRSSCCSTTYCHACLGAAVAWAVVFIYYFLPHSFSCICHFLTDLTGTHVKRTGKSAAKCVGFVERCGQSFAGLCACVRVCVRLHISRFVYMSPFVCIFSPICMHMETSGNSLSFCVSLSRARARARARSLSLHCHVLSFPRSLRLDVCN